MKYWKAIPLVGAGLVAGLVVGSMTIAGAAAPKAPVVPKAPAAAATCSTGCATGAATGGRGLGMRFGRSGLGLVDIVAKLTGLSEEDVAAARADGKSFADIADDKGVSADEVVAEALKARTEALDARVKDGSITAEQRDEILAQMKTNLESRVTSTDANRGFGRMGGGCGMGGRGRGPGAGASTTAPVVQPETY